MRPELRPDRAITLVSSYSTALYSGMVPALIAGVVKRTEASINLRWLAQQAGVAFAQAPITGIDPQGDLRLKDRQALSFGFLSLNLGAVTRRKGYLKAIAIKPLEPALRAISAQDALANNPITHPFHCVGAGLAAVEIALALRQRWPQRPLILHTGGRSLHTSIVRELLQAHIQLSDAPAPDTADTLLCTGSEAPSWLAESGLACDNNGRVLTHPTLQALNQHQIFAAGDCAVIQGMERPPSGVWAVRAAQPLARNLEQISRGQTPQPWRPQHRALQLLGITIGARREAWLLWGNTCLGPHPWLWRWKQQLDHNFMERFRPQAAMNTDLKRQGDHAMACRGCAAQLPADPLEEALSCCQRSPSQRTRRCPYPRHEQGRQCYPGGWLPCPNKRSLAERTTDHPARLLRPVGQRRAGHHRPSDRDQSQPDSSAQVNLLGRLRACAQLTEQGASLIGGTESRQASSSPPALDLQVSLSVTGETPPGQQPWGKGGIQPGDICC